MRLKLLKLAVSCGMLLASLLLMLLQAAVLVSRMVYYGTCLGFAYMILSRFVFTGLPQIGLR